MHTGGALSKLLSDDGLTLEFPVKPDRHNDRLQVEVEFNELINCPDIISWWMTRVTRNVTITLQGLPESWSVDVETFHPAPRQLVSIGKNQWRFTGIMLPGQGIEIRIRPLTSA
jgi:hypothetical protein